MTHRLGATYTELPALILISCLLVQFLIWKFAFMLAPTAVLLALPVAGACLGIA